MPFYTGKELNPDDLEASQTTKVEHRINQRRCRKAMTEDEERAHAASAGVLYDGNEFWLT